MTRFGSILFAAFFAAFAALAAQGTGSGTAPSTATGSASTATCADGSLPGRWYTDKDGDGYGNRLSTLKACDQPQGYVADASDCNDASSAVKPGASEVCDGADNDCDKAIDEADATDAATWYQDKDLDRYGNSAVTRKACRQPTGFVADSSDCDDARGTTKPGGTELCDGVDNNCDGSTDEDTASNAKTWYADSDGDGYGLAASSKRSCAQPAGHLALAGDCADDAAGVNPKATETCDGRDNDCDGKTDEPDATDSKLWYQDKDGDSYGNKLAPTRACAAPAGYVADATDCSDSASVANPGGTEVCDGKDNNCNGQIDEPDATDARTWYQDKDLDRAGNAAISKKACNQPAGFVADSGDCDDARGAAKPNGTELCDGIDNNCDGSVDEDSASNAKTWYADSDSDGYGLAASSKKACAQPAGYLASAGDCADDAAGVNPKAAETCDGRDNDCDGKTDEPDASDAKVWYRDGDGDSFGGKLSSLRACNQPQGYVSDATDCNDAASVANPSAAEVCDGKDNNCNGQTDEPDATDAKTWFQDKDLDRYGNSGVSKKACNAPSGYVADSSDCDDARGAAKPGGTELCDGIDNNCDGSTDEDAAVNAKTWYADGDSDGYGDARATKKACAQPTGYLALAGDCADNAGNINPKAAETCDGSDNDCDGKTDEPDASDAKTWYRDGDGDSFGGKLSSTRACSQPQGYVADNTDCNDASGAANPSATEVCDGRDNDCDASTDEPDASDAKTWYRDADADRYGDAGSSKKACSAGAGYVADSSDCDDARGAIRPGASELCDGADNDCDGSTDEDDAVNAKSWYADADSDGFGDRSATRRACSAPGGYVADARDCDDDKGGVNPQATEVCDSVDNDCDLKTDENDASDAKTWYADSDSDQYGDAKLTTRACTQPRGYVSDSSDCNPRAGSANPGAEERCDGLDNDCDAVVDEDDAVDAKTWYADTDGDRYGDLRGSKKSCKLPAGYVVNDDDCDDSSKLALPGGREVCDGLDNDCDGTTDNDSAIGAPTWYQDGDSDEFGDRASPKVACNAPSGYVKDATDCNDDDGSTHPGAPEYCDGKDNNCNEGDENGLVTFVSGSKREDLSATFAAGRPGAPAAWTAPGEGTLTFCDGTWYTSLTLPKDGVTVRSLRGRDTTTLNGGGTGTVITTRGDATIQGLTLSGGKNGDSGGGIEAQGGTLKLQDVRLSNNEANAFGGGLYAQHTRLVLDQVDISGNKAHSGGGLYGYYTEVQIRGGSVATNEAVDGAGVYARFGKVELNGATVSDNTARSQGGGVLLSASSLSCSNEGGTRNNTASRGASAILSEGSSITANGCGFSGGEIYVDEVGPFTPGSSFSCDQKAGCK